LHQVGTSSLLIYMMHGHTYIKYRWNVTSTSLKTRNFQVPFSKLNLYS